MSDPVPADETEQVFLADADRAWWITSRAERFRIFLARETTPGKAETTRLDGDDPRGHDREEAQRIVDSLRADGTIAWRAPTADEWRRLSELYDEQPSRRPS